MKLNMQRRLQMKVLLVSKITQKYPAKSKDVSANATVTVSRGTHLAKNSRYNPKTQTIEWTITFNGDQRDIKKADALLKDVLDKSHKVDKNSIVVKMLLMMMQENLLQVTTPQTLL